MTGASKTGASKTGTSKTGTRKKTKTKTKTKTRTRTSKRKTVQTGGELSLYQKDKIADIVILLVAGSGYWLAPVIESFIVSIGLLPVLCGQNLIEHMASNLYAAEGQSCAARASRYNTIINSFVAIITASSWYNSSKFTKAYLSKNYKKIHRLVKKQLFTSTGTTPSPTPSPVAGFVPPAPAPARSRSPTGSQSPPVIGRH